MYNDGKLLYEVLLLFENYIFIAVDTEVRYQLTKNSIGKKKIFNGLYKLQSVKSMLLFFTVYHPSILFIFDYNVSLFIGKLS